MKYIIERISSEELEGLVAPLAALQWEEVDIRNSRPLNVQWGHYRGLMEHGINLWLGVFSEEGDLVGYISLLTSPSLHTEGTMSVVDTVYVLPEHRSNGLGRALVDNAVEVAKAEGAKYFTINTKTSDTRTSTMLDGCGFTAHEVVHVKEL